MKQDFPQPISEQIWNAKYRLTTPNPDIKDDQYVSDTWSRVARACADAPLTIYPGGNTQGITLNMQAERECSFRSVLEDFNFLTAGRITAGAGSGRNVTLFNCYVMGDVPDDISGIFESLREAALTMQQGGGIGYDFSNLRPNGSPVKGVDADASGPLSFMDVWDSMCRTIMSAGYRRGAMMATLRCDHPDIEAFVVAKHDPTRLRMFNMSVLCTNAFMQAVKDDAAWDLVHISSPPKTSDIVGQNVDGVALWRHKTIRARDLWKLIMDSTYNYAEPGVLFVDVINQKNNLWYAEEISATNPCGEQPLPPYGACLLGSVNLTKMVSNPFSYQAEINYTRIAEVAKIATRMLDSVIDMSNFPLPQQKVEALNKRRMGVGITGLADMLFMIGETYGSPKAAKTAAKVMETITVACYEESIQMAQEYGPCPATTTLKQRQQYLQSGFMDIMPYHIKDGIMEHGIRNALLTSIAPTGTISMYAGNVSSGIEPIFAAEYTRKILENDGVTHRTEVVKDYAVNLLDTVDGRFSISQKMSELVTAQTLTPADHLIMLKAVQPWVDSSISKTINCPEDISFDNFQEIYLEAYNMGLKGCTTYRPNDVTGSVLSVESDEKELAPIVDGEIHMLLAEPMPRPNNLTGTTYKLKWDGKSYYITINDYPDENGHTIPFEIFINSSSMESLQWTVALTRMISAVFRRGGQVKFIGEELKRISDPSGGQWINKKFVPSFVALIGETLENHLTMLDRINELDIGYEGIVAFDDHEKFNTPEMSEAEFVRREHNQAIMATCPDQCPGCKVYAIIRSSGCDTCTNCGYSKCG